MTKIWNEFINYPAERWKEAQRGRYYVISWTPVRSIHNPNRCQIHYRRWRGEDFYPENKLIQTNAIVTRPNGAKEPVITHVNTQIEIAKEYEAIVKEEAKKPPLEIEEKRDVIGDAMIHDIKGGIKLRSNGAYGALGVLLVMLIVLWYFLLGNNGRG